MSNRSLAFVVTEQPSFNRDPHFSGCLFHPILRPCSSLRKKSVLILVLSLVQLVSGTSLVNPPHRSSICSTPTDLEIHDRRSARMPTSVARTWDADESMCRDVGCRRSVLSFLHLGDGWESKMHLVLHIWCFEMRKKLPTSPPKPPSKVIIAAALMIGPSELDEKGLRKDWAICVPVKLAQDLHPIERSTHKFGCELATLVGDWAICHTVST